MGEILVSKLLLTTALLLAFLPNSHADEVDKAIDSAIKLTGLDKLIEHVPDFAQSSLDQGKGAIDPKVWNALSNEIPNSYNQKDVSRDLVRYLKENNDPKMLDAYVAFLKSDQIKRFAAKEGGSNMVPQKFRQYVDSRPQDFHQSKRSLLISRLDDATRSSEFSLDIQTAFFRTIFQAVNPFLDPDMRLKDGELNGMSDEVRNSLLKSTKDMTLFSYSFAYQEFSDKEIEEYVQAYEKKEHKWAVRFLGNGMMYAIDQAGKRMEKSLSGKQFSDEMIGNNPHPHSKINH